MGTGDGPVMGGEEARGVGADRDRCEPELMALKPLGQGALTGKIWGGDADRNGLGSTGTLVVNAGR